MKALLFAVLAGGLTVLGLAGQVVECKTVSWQAGKMYCEQIPVTTTTTTTLAPACLPQKLNGLTIDKCSHPMEAQAKPAYLQSYVDQAFGTTIRRISNVPISDGENAVIRPLYSTMQAWNDDESLMVLYKRGRVWPLLNGKTYAFIKNLDLRSPTDVEQLNWIGNDSILYPSNYNALPELVVHKVSTGANTVIRNFSGPPTNCPSGDWSNLLKMGTDPMRMSWPTSYVIGLQCGSTKFAYDVATSSIVGQVTIEDPYQAPMPTPSGNRFLLYGRSYDRTLTSSFGLIGLNSVVEHASIGLDNAGVEVYASVVFGGPNEGNLVLHSMTPPGALPRVIVGPASGWPPPRPGTHVSAIAYKSPGTMTVSIVGVPSRNGVLDQELLLWQAGQVYRIGHHRSLAGEGQWGYFGEPHASPSPTGTRVLFASDWGGGPSVDTYVVELPGYVR